MKNQNIYLMKFIKKWNFIYLEYNNIKFQIRKNITKQLLPDIESLNEIPMNQNIMKYKKIS